MENQPTTAGTAGAAAQGKDSQAGAAAAGFSDRIRERARVVKSQLDAAETKARQRWAESKTRAGQRWQESKAGQRWAESRTRAGQRWQESKAGQRIHEVPVKLRTALNQAVGKVRNGLDLPSRRDVTQLAQRIDELDRKLGEYEVQSSARRKRRGENGDFA